MASVAVVGLGKLGLPMAGLYAQAGHEVIGIDKNSIAIQHLRNGSYDYAEPGLNKLIADNNIKYFDNYSHINSCEYIFIVVPTPSKITGEFSNQYIEEALESIVKNLDDTPNPHHIILTSTVMPGSCEKLYKEYIQPLNKKVKLLKLSLVYSPEFIALGSVIKDLQKPDMLLIGAEEAESRFAAREILSSILSQRAMPSSSRCTFVEAELAKLALNNYLSIKTAFANSMGELATSLGADPHVVLEVVGSDSRVGEKFLRSGMTACGPCIPRDTVAMRKLSWDQNVPPFLSRSAEMIHDRRKSYLLTLAQHSGGPYAVVGLSYKPNVPVFDASPTVWLTEKLVAYVPSVMKVWDPSLVCPEGLEKYWKLTLSEALEGVKTVVVGDVSSDVLHQVMEFYEQNKDVRIVDCWRS